MASRVPPASPGVPEDDASGLPGAEGPGVSVGGMGEPGPHLGEDLVGVELPLGMKAERGPDAPPEAEHRGAEDADFDPRRGHRWSRRAGRGQGRRDAMPLENEAKKAHGFGRAMPPALGRVQA